MARALISGSCQRSITRCVSRRMAVSLSTSASGGRPPLDSPTLDSPTPKRFTYGDDDVEVLYLGAGVVRRGWFDVTRPALRRDRAGKVVNTPLRHNRDQPPRGTHFLAGELYAGAITTRP